MCVCVRACVCVGGSVIKTIALINSRQRAVILVGFTMYVCIVQNSSTIVLDFAQLHKTFRIICNVLFLTENRQARKHCLNRKSLEEEKITQKRNTYKYRYTLSL